MRPDLLEGFLEALDRTAAGPREPLAVLRGEIASDGDAAQVLEPLYKHLCGEPRVLDELVDQLSAARRAHPFRGLAYRADRDSRVRAWALDRALVDTRPLAAILDRSFRAFRDEARSRVHAFIGAEARLRLEALGGLIALQDAAEGLAVEVIEPAVPRSGGGATIPAVPWLGTCAIAVALAIVAFATVREPESALAPALVAALAAASAPWLGLPMWMRRAWARYRAAPAPSVEPPLAISEQLAVALESPTAEEVRPLLAVLRSMPRTRSATVMEAGRALRRAFEAAELPELVTESPAGKRSLRAMTEAAHEAHAIHHLARTCGAAGSLPVPPSFSGAWIDEGEPKPWALPDDVLDELVALLTRLEQPAGEEESRELSEHRIAEVRRSLRELPPSTRRHVDAAIFEMLAALCGRWSGALAMWCERVTERLQIAAVDPRTPLPDAQLLARLDELACRVRLGEGDVQQAILDAEQEPVPSELGSWLGATEDSRGHKAFAG